MRSTVVQHITIITVLLIDNLSLLSCRGQLPAKIDVADRQNRDKYADNIYVSGNQSQADDRCQRINQRDLSVSNTTQGGLARQRQVQF